MSEDVRPFEEYKEMIKDMRKEEMIRGLYDLSKNITEKGKEIERLNSKVEELMTLYTTEREVKEDYKSIIKEVRKKLLCYGETFDLKVHQEMQKELLEILDKEKV